MISIVIPVWNAHEMTRDCLEAVRANTKDYELVIVDNESTPPIEGATIRNESNLGFPVAVNQGIRAAGGDVIVLLNNDVVVTPGSLNRLADCLDDYAITAPVANYCAGLQQEAKLPTYQNEKELFDIAQKWAEENEGDVWEVNFVIGFCMAFRKSLWEELGDFDESIWPCSGEEIDFCFRAREKGYKIGIVRASYVHHIGSQTFAAMEKEGLLKYSDTIYQNDLHLARKWGNDFWTRQTGEIKASKPVATNNGKLRLNLGSGKYKLEGFVNVDQLENVHPDLVADALKLPYEPGAVDEIYAGHLLEHLTWDEGQAALRHWHALLKVGGTIMLTVPDFDVLARKYLDNPTAKNMRFMNDWYIYSYVQESHHRYCYGPALLKAAMTEAGFGDIEKMPYEHPYFTSSMRDQITLKGVR